MEEQKNEIAKKQQAAPAAASAAAPSVIGAEIERRKALANLYAVSSFLPAAWRKLPDVEKVADLVILIGRAEALGCDVMLLLQNLTFIAGNVGWKSTFLLQLLQAHGWTAPKYIATGDPNSADFWGKEENGMAFSAVNPTTGERETGTKITVKMVIGERWLDREGSKWKTMAEQMFKYRAAAFFCRTNAPAVLGGFYAQDELEDIAAQEKTTYSGPISVPIKQPMTPPEPEPEIVKKAEARWIRSSYGDPTGDKYHD